MASAWIVDRPPVEGRKRWLVGWRSVRLQRLGAPDAEGSSICYSRKEAVDLRDEKKRELQRREVGLEPAIKAQPVALGHFSDEYLAYCVHRPLARNTIKNFIRPTMNGLVQSFGRDKRLDHITPREASAWLYAIQCGNTTRRMHYDNATAFFNYAIGMKAMKENPLAPLDSPVDDEGGRALTDPELLAIFRVAHPILLKTGRFALNTGPRIGEIVGPLGLDWARVEAQLRPGDELMRLWDVLARDPARALSAAWFGRIPAKTRKTARQVTQDCVFPINAAARAVMGEPRPAGRVFPHAVNTVQGLMTEAREKAGVSGASFHWFRHTFATRYLKHGGHAEDLLETRLWSNYDSLRRYVHPDRATLAQRFGQLSYPGC